MFPIIYAAWMLVMNLFGLILMAVDKSFAKRHARRVPERTLFLTAALGGCLGCWAGMYLTRHKTRHWRFVIGMPLLTAAHTVLACKIFRIF